MPYVMVTSWVPNIRVNKSVEIYMELMKKYPPQDWENDVVLLGVMADGDCIKSISVSEVPKAKLGEAMELAAKRMLLFWPIEGYRYVIDTLLTGSEAMPMIGKAMPQV